MMKADCLHDGKFKETTRGLNTIQRWCQVCGVRGAVKKLPDGRADLQAVR